MRMICAAIKDDVGKIWLGKRHSDCLFLMSRFSVPVNPRSEGFVDRLGNFYNRKEAMKFAIEAGQVDKKNKGLELFSEDLY